MLELQDTIVAISTPPGVGAISIVRMSGPNAIDICDKVFHSMANKKLADQPANTLHHGYIMDGNSIVDEVIVGLFREPHSYTGEDIVEISCHGSLFIQQKLLELLISKGARLAKPGEFTLRAFLNGKIDLSQAEAIADLISSTSASLQKIAIHQMRGGFTKELKDLRDKLINFVSLIELELDFGEEDVEFADRSELKNLLSNIINYINKLKDSFRLGNAIKRGIPVAIAGKTNTGKSTLLNLLLKEDKAIVSDIPGTTRDVIEDTISINGFLFRFIDTAGLRHTHDVVEKIGIEKALKKINQADIILYVIDGTDEIETVLQDFNVFYEKIKANQKKLIIVINKLDAINQNQKNRIFEKFKNFISEDLKIVFLSAKYNINLEELENILLQISGCMNIKEEQVIVVNIRHYEALLRSYEALKRVMEGLEKNLPGDLLSQDIREAIHYIGEITGEVTNDEILNNIFKNFCIGK